MTEVTKKVSCNMELRSAVFEVLRRHNVSEQCFAEVAMITQSAVTVAESEIQATCAKIAQLEGELGYSEQQFRLARSRIAQLEKVMQGIRDLCSQGTTGMTEAAMAGLLFNVEQRASAGLEGTTPLQQFIQAQNT